MLENLGYAQQRPTNEFASEEKAAPNWHSHGFDLKGIIVFV